MFFQVSRAASRTGRSFPKYVLIYTVKHLMLKVVHAGKCYAQTDVPKQCAPQAEDYLECLHHTKEVRTLDSAQLPAPQLCHSYTSFARLLQ